MYCRIQNKRDRWLNEHVFNLLITQLVNELIAWAEYIIRQILSRTVQV